MSVSLKSTLSLAEKGVLTDKAVIEETVTDLLNVPYLQLRKASNMFSFVEEVFYPDEEDEFLKKLTLRDILKIADSLRDPDDDINRYCVVQNIAFGILNADSIPEVKRFLSVSVWAFLNKFAPGEYSGIRALANIHAKFCLHVHMSMRDFLKNTRSAVWKTWFIGGDIEEYRLNIIRSTEMLDMALIRSISALL